MEKLKKKLQTTSFWKLLEQWANSDGVAEGEYSERMTCRPNCNSDKGGPPFCTVLFSVFLVIFYYTYMPFADFMTWNTSFIETVDLAIHTLPLTRWMDFGETCNKALENDNFNELEEWFLLHNKVSEYSFKCMMLDEDDKILATRMRLGMTDDDGNLYEIEPSKYTTPNMTDSSGNMTGLVNPRAPVYGVVEVEICINAGKNHPDKIEALKKLIYYDWKKASEYRVSLLTGHQTKCW